MHILRKPLEGARNHGVGGFVTGIGKASETGLILIFGRLAPLGLFGQNGANTSSSSRDFDILGCQGLTSSVIKGVNGVAAARLHYFAGLVSKCDYDYDMKR